MKLTKSFFNDIRKLILGARTTVARGVDLVQVHTNFEIGRRIVEQEQHGKDRAEYGQQIVKTLAARLTEEFGKGFSKSNLETTRRFFLCYQERIRIAQSATGQLTRAAKGQSPTDQFPIAQSLTGQSDHSSARPFNLSWTQYVLLLTIENPDERSRPAEKR